MPRRTERLKAALWSFVIGLWWFLLIIVTILLFKEVA